jgi:hypothetical protein
MKKFLRHNIFALYVVSFSLASFLTAPFLSAEITLREKLQKADELSNNGFENASEARRVGDLGLAKSALENANEATVILSEVVEEASLVVTEVLDKMKKEDYCLAAEAALTTHYNISKATTQTIYASSYIAQTSTSPKTVSESREIFKDANELIEKLDQIQKRIIEILRACGIEPIIPEPYKLPEEEKLLIKEIEPASPI